MLTRCQTTLVTLPAEIRNKIWEFTLCGGSVEIDINSPVTPLPSITKAFRQTLVETLGIFFHQTKISFIILDYNGTLTETTFWDDFRGLVGLVAELGGHNDMDKVDLEPCYILSGSPTWSNILAWAKASYDSTEGRVLSGKSADGNWQVVAHMMNTVSDLWEMDAPWEQVELVLESMSQIAAIQNQAWR